MDDGLPTSTDDAEIQGTIEVAANASIADLTIASGGSLTINNGVTFNAATMTNAASLTVTGAMNIATGVVSTVNSSGSILVNGATGNLTIGASGKASSLNLTAGSLTLNNGAAQLNVFGDLIIADGVTLSNSGIITVGE